MNQIKDPLQTPSMVTSGPIVDTEELLANAATQRPPRPGGPDPNKCKRLLRDIVTLLQEGGKLSSGEVIKRSLKERFRQMRKDDWGLYEGKNSGMGTWEGHKKIYNNRRIRLEKILEEWDRGNCGKWPGEGVVSVENIAKVIEQARVWAEKLPPEKPDRYLEKGFKLPDFNIDWESIGEGLKTGVEFLLIPLWLLKEIFSPSWQQASLEDHALSAQEKQINEQSTPSSTAQWKIEDVGQNPLRSAVLDTVIFVAELTQDGEELPDGSLVTSNEAFTSVIDPNGVNLGIFKPDQSLAAVLDLETTEIEMQMDQENIAFFTDLQGLIAQVKTEMSQDSAMEVEDLGGYG